VGNVAFLMKDVVLLAASFYQLKQDAVRMASGARQDVRSLSYNGAQVKSQS
jgi:hypothetical protein